MIPTDHCWSDDLIAARRVGYSQYGEEGMIERLLADLGTTSRYLVDIGAGDGRTLSNTQALLDAGWHGVRFDVAPGGDVHQERITAENVGDLLARHNVPPEPDFLSLDIDGVDWWVLRAVLRAGYHPRAFVCEINPALPTQPPVTVVYDPGFVFSQCDYFGASLGAFQLLAAAYDYRCVVVNESINAFFVVADALPVGVRLSVEHRPRQPWPRDPRRRAWHALSTRDVP